MKRFILFFILVALSASCTRQARLRPDILLNPPTVVVSVGDTALVRIATNSDGRRRVSVNDTTIAKATLEGRSVVFVYGVKKGSATLKFETGYSQRFNAGEASCPILVTDYLEKR